MRPDQLDDLAGLHGDRLWRRVLDVADTARTRAVGGEACATEMGPFGIRTVLVEPGMIRTGFYDAAQNTETLPSYAGREDIVRRAEPARTSRR